MKDPLYKFSLLVEQYYIEIFTFEALLIILAIPSVRLLERLILAIIITVVVSEGIKIFVRESRPAPALERKFYKRSFKLNLRSFPSTHAAIAMAFAGLLAHSFIFFPVFVFGLIMAYSRVYIKDHYWHDIIAGGAIGFIIGYILITFI